MSAMLSAEGPSRSAEREVLEQRPPPALDLSVLPRVVRLRPILGSPCDAARLGEVGHELATVVTYHGKRPRRLLHLARINEYATVSALRSGRTSQCVRQEALNVVGNVNSARCV
jgi:hypothetical protein